MTAKIRGIATGSWAVSAERIEAPDDTAGQFDVEDPQTATVWTTAAPLVHGPGVRLWTWPLLVGSGAVFAIVMQALLLTRANENAPWPFSSQSSVAFSATWAQSSGTWHFIARAFEDLSVRAHAFKGSWWFRSRFW